MVVERIHHVAYRCRDTRETVNFCRDVLDADFLDAGSGHMLAFFEIPRSPPMGQDPNTPNWVQHLAFKVRNMATLCMVRERLVARGIEVGGPTNHELIYSIHFFDPDGHRIELACDTATPERLRKLHDIELQVLEDWSRSKRTIRHAAWLHEEEFADA